MDSKRRYRLVVSTTELTVRPESRKEFFQTVALLSEKIRKEKGCLNFRLYEESGNENSVMLVGEWEGQESWEGHRAGKNFSVLHGSVKVLSVRPTIDFTLLRVLADSKALIGF